MVDATSRPVKRRAASRLRRVRSRTTVGIVAIAVLLAFLGWLLARNRDDPILGAPPNDTPRSATANDASPQIGDVTRASDASSTTDRSAVPPPAPTPPPLDPEHRRIRGTIVVTDAAGTRFDRTNGTMHLDLLTPMQPAEGHWMVNEVVAEVHDGQWEVQAPRTATELNVGDLALDGRPGRCDDKAKIPADDALIVLQARWLDPLRLRVLGDDTGADLADIRVVRMSDWMRDECTHPGNTDITIVLAHGTSPLLVPNDQRIDEVRFWVHAPGYAWNQIVLATAERGERTMRLVPGGDVDVTVVGTPPAGSVLRVRKDNDDGTPFTECALRGSTTRIEALPAGRWQLALEKGKWFQDPVVSGTTTVDVTRGTIGAATITVNAPTRPPIVHLQGTLQLDAEWGEKVTVEFEPMRSLRAWVENSVDLPLSQMTPLGDGRYRFGPVPATAGRYGVIVRGCEHRVVVDVGPADPTEIDIVVPPPQLVRVRLLDAVTGAAILGRAPSWYRHPPEGWDIGWGHTQCSDAVDGWYELRAGLGPIAIHVDAEGYAFTTETRTVVAGRNEFELRLPRACGVLLSLKDGDVAIPWPDHLFVQIENVVTKTSAAYWSGNRIATKEPGEHTLRFPPLDGYEPIPERTVLVNPGEWATVEIALKRKS